MRKFILPFICVLLINFTAFAQGLKLQYRDGGNGSATDNQINPHLQIINETAQAVPYSQLKIRYWFTNENPAPLNFWCDWAQLGSSFVQGSFTTLATPVAGASHYVELSFAAGAGSLAANGNSGNIQGRFAKTNWSNFNEVGDYSYDAAKTNYALHSKVTLYQNGVLVYGQEPGSGSVNIAPVASFTATPTSGRAPLTVAFNGSASTDANNDPLTYAWAFGDGTSGTGATVSHIYTAVGVYTATLTVSDGKGGTNAKTATITVTANRAPVANFTATPSSGPAPLTVAFNASTSTDPDGDALTYAWVFGDGTTGTGATVSHVYTAVGTYTARLTVSDGKGGSNAKTATITVTVGGTNTAPVASFTATPTSGRAPLTVAFNGSASTDANGDALTYAWAFGDGTSGTGATVSHIYTAVGVYTATLTVSDGKGGSNAKTATITVTANRAPVANFTAAPSSGAAPLTTAFNASTSTDADGDVLSYAWVFGDGTTGTGATVSHVYTAAGTYTATLTVSDGKGGSNAKSVTITAGSTPPVGTYLNRFTTIRNKFYNPANGYFSPEGAPYHSIESLIVEAPDHGHTSTSELYSYWIYLEAMQGRVSGDWKPLNDAWLKMEQHIIPTHADQPTNAAYNPSKPATYAPEFADPCLYPAPLNFSTPVGQDPVSPDLTSSYGTSDVYGMHWLLDADNFYGYGNRADGISKPSYINTFQRGEQESVWETVPQPSWDAFKWGGPNGFLPIFTGDQSYSKQWRYTNAPDADARVVQAMYWANQWAKDQNLTPSSVIPVAKAARMGDYVRLSMFDKYFKPIGAQTPNGPGATGYQSAHYLLSWYYAWGGSADPASAWAWRIGSSHCHFGYQNPVAAWALSAVPDLKPKSANGARDWGTSLQRQMEFYEYLQSKEGAIAGGATNSWNGNYSAYPAGKSTFYGMAYDDNPVYHDPGSNTWAGWQAWSMERVAEYYYLTNDARAKRIMDKWIVWAKGSIKLVGTNDFDIPSTIAWTGQPNQWNPASPVANTTLSVTVVDYSKDLGIAASFAKALTFYAAATRKYGTLDVASRELAKQILDRIWNTYQDTKGFSSPESRGDYSRFFEQTICIPSGFVGTMPNGDVIKPGVKFLDIRSKYKQDPDYQRLLTSYQTGQPFAARYHRSWAQIEIALANAEYGFFFDDGSAREGLTEGVSTTFFPNPVESSLNVQSKTSLKGKTLELVDNLGVVRVRKAISTDTNSTMLDMQQFKSGVYFVRVIEGAKVSTTKVVKR